MISQTNLNAYEAEARGNGRVTMTVSCEEFLQLIEEVRLIITQQADTIDALEHPPIKTS